MFDWKAAKNTRFMIRIWNTDDTEYTTVLLVMYALMYLSEQEYAAWLISDEMADLHIFISAIYHTTSMSNDFHWMSLNDLFRSSSINVLDSTIGNLLKEIDHTLQNVIYDNATVQARARGRNNGAAKSTSKEELLIVHLDRLEIEILGYSKPQIQRMGDWAWFGFYGGGRAPWLVTRWQNIDGHYMLTGQRSQCEIGLYEYNRPGNSK